MIQSIEDFIRFIPTARGTNYEDIAPFVEEGLLWSKTEIFGEQLISAIYAGINNEAIRLLDSIVALKAYAGAIPFLDVVQTSNGFAVVNNANKAPASRDRVQRLLTFVNERLFEHTDMLIEYVTNMPELMRHWRAHFRFEYLTELVYWTGSDLVQYGGDYEKNATNISRATVNYKGGSALRMEASNRRIPWLELRRLHATIKGIQDEQLSNYISSDYMHELIDKNRLQILNADETKIFNKLRFIVGLFLQNEDFKATEQLGAIVNEMVRTPDKFTTYAASDTYQLKIAERYRNREKDSTYFFV